VIPGVERRLVDGGAHPIVLLTERGTVEPADLRALHEGHIVACDCYVREAERWDPVPGGWAVDRLVNVDHHAPAARMEREVSSTNLALERAEACGPEPAGTITVVTHTDCDSVLSAGIVSGRLEPRAEYGDAAIAADHTGAEEGIADLLQALDPWRDLERSFGALARLEAARPLPRDAQALLDARRRDRDTARRLVASGSFVVDDFVAAARIGGRVDGEFFPALLPEAWLIVLALPLDATGRHWEIKVRRGLHAPSWLTVHALRIQEFDPRHGGRWNAGSNRRNGGTVLSPEAYAAALRERLRSLVAVHQQAAL
jgi:hypothetical protein